jgi:hypothetical protein
MMWRGRRWRRMIIGVCSYTIPIIARSSIKRHTRESCREEQSKREDWSHRGQARAPWLEEVTGDEKRQRNNRERVGKASPYVAKIKMKFLSSYHLLSQPS